jgi:hypothetical protein
MDLAAVPSHGDAEQISRLQRIAGSDCDGCSLCSLATVSYGLLKEHAADEIREGDGEVVGAILNSADHYCLPVGRSLVST